MLNTLYIDQNQSYEISYPTSEPVKTVSMHIVDSQCWKVGQAVYVGTSGDVAYWSATIEKPEEEKEQILDDEALGAYFTANAVELNADAEDWLLVSRESARLNFE